MNRTDESKHAVLDAKYARIINAISELHGISIEEAMDCFYNSQTSQLIEDGVSDLHCRSDKYLAEEVWLERIEKLENENKPASINLKPINRIKVVLAENGRTNKWLSEKLGVAQATVSKWCTNSCQPPMETFMRISTLLGVSLNDLVRFDALSD